MVQNSLNVPDHLALKDLVGRTKADPEAEFVDRGRDSQGRIVRLPVKLMNRR